MGYLQHLNTVTRSIYMIQNVNKRFNLRTLEESIEIAGGNKAIVDCYLKANSVVNRYRNPYCSISGGKDSDIMLDVIRTVDKDNRVRYVWFDTGIEYKATKEHLKYLEEKYDIEIEHVKAIKPIPICVKEFGQPFLSKMVSEQMMRLQKHDFQWEDDTYENLALKYPKIKSAISWWTNHRDTGNFGYSQFNINYNRYLKEFILANPPTFKISNKCCVYAKKKVGKQYAKDNSCDLSIIGVRKSEGGVRASRYKSCFDPNTDADKDDIARYRPLFWYKNEDEDVYDELFDIVHSDCYSVYGMTRTGCVGCPYNKKINEEMAIIEKYEPNLAKAAKNIFQESYEYTQKYREFVKLMKATNKTEK